jgi:hypothetical protein
MGGQFLAMSHRTSIFWRRLDTRGYERASIHEHSELDRWLLVGNAWFVAADGEPCHLHYNVSCDLQWRTQHAEIYGWIGRTPYRFEIWADSQCRWTSKQVEIPSVAGCVDLDLAISPATKTLPIRRLDLAVGEEAEVRAACLRFPELTLEPLDQRYKRLVEATYRYQCDGARVVADLRVSQDGFVLNYPGLWTSEPEDDVRTLRISP